MLKNKYCETCYFSNACYCDDMCDYYYPADEFMINENIDNIIEDNRISFRAQWFCYIEEFNS